MSFFCSQESIYLLQHHRKNIYLQCITNGHIYFSKQAKEREKKTQQNTALSLSFSFVSLIVLLLANKGSLKVSEPFHRRLMQPPRSFLTDFTVVCLWKRKSSKDEFCYIRREDASPDAKFKLYLKDAIFYLHCFFFVFFSILPHSHQGVCFEQLLCFWVKCVIWLWSNN